MLDAHPADLPVVDNAVLVGELAHLLALLGRLDVLVGGKVVRHESDPLRVKDAVDAQAGELVDGDRRRDVIGQHHVDLDIDQFTHSHIFAARVRRQDFCAMVIGCLAVNVASLCAQFGLPPA